MFSIRNILIAMVALAAVIGIYYYFTKESDAEKKNVQIKAPVKKGDFIITVTATGELQAKRSEKIQGPQGMRSVGIYQTNITDMVSEGTIVKAGDYVATLDKTEIANKMREVQSELDKIMTQLDQAKIDTAIDLRAIRDQLINLQFSKKEKQLQLEQSKYEPQAVIQQAQLEMEKTEREFNQLQNSYKLKQQQAESKILEITTSLKQNQDKFNMMNQISQQFMVNAPKGGMVIYSRRWGETKSVGSQVSAWDPVVAELPDLSDMVSKTYVNEVDISRVKIGQEVKVKVDAFPDKKYSGKVIKVANIGEQLRNYDSKVFEVTVQVNERDSILRPAMTTSIEINTETFKDKLSIPLEALHNDSIAYVYKILKDNSLVKQEIITGPSNSDQIIVEHGLTATDQVYLTMPDHVEKLKFVPIDPKIKAEIKRKQEEEEKKRQAEAQARLKAMKPEDLPSDNNGGGGGMIIIE